jgi:hypothetical protein
LVGVAVKVTGVDPEGAVVQILVEVAVIDTEGLTVGLTVTVTGFIS